MSLHQGVLKMGSGTGITHFLKKSRNRQTRLQKAHEWADEWQNRHNHFLNEIADAYNQDKPYRLQNLINKLKEFEDDKIKALHNVIDELDTPTRELINNDE